ncbi:MAG: glycosyltransferase family 39 protein [Saprospiraceae bacterium]|nr:glycosyltransferase family 39 protein [Saprospiraceae bacterium]
MTIPSLLRNPWVLFLPFLVLYACITWLTASAALMGDEGRYLEFAGNLLQGYYSPKEGFSLWNGPGYPIAIAPLVAVGAPRFLMLLANAVFQYLSVVFLFKTLNLFLHRRAALALTIGWGLYFTAYETLPYVLSDTFATLLATLAAYFTIKTLKDGKGAWKAGLIWGWLLLTKVIFAYVFPLVLGLILIKIKSQNARKSLAIFGIAYLVALPYLFYTYQLTGRWYYWSDSGGMSLYWMSTPYPDEYGDWNNERFVGYFKGMALGDAATAALKARHQADFDEIYRYEGPARDDVFKKKAIANIKAHPGKYALNCLANVSRMFFGFPISYVGLKLHYLVRLVPGSIVFTLMLFCLLNTPFLWRQMPAAIKILFATGVIYLAGSTLLSAYPRMLSVILPLLLCWMGYVLGNRVIIRG